MSHVDADTVADRTFSKCRHQNRFLSVHIVNLIARCVRFLLIEFLVSSLFEQFQRAKNALALGLSCIQKCLVSLAECICLLILLRCFLADMREFPHQFLLEQLSGTLLFFHLCHDIHSFFTQ